jgi:AcrR family transcriptional regulator
MPKLAPETQAARRDHILDAAASCFARAGFHGTSMHDICAAAEVSPGALYTYFASKEELIAGLVEREKERFVKQLAKASEAPDLLDALRSMAEHFCCEEPQHKLRLHVEIGAEAARNDALGETVRQMDRFVMDSFAELLTQAKAKGRIDPLFEIQTVVRAMAALGDGLFWHRALDENFDPRPVLPAVMVMVSALIRPVTPAGAEAPFNLEDVA